MGPLSRGLLECQWLPSQPTERKIKVKKGERQEKRSVMPYYKTSTVETSVVKSKLKFCQPFLYLSLQSHATSLDHMTSHGTLFGR